MTYEKIKRLNILFRKNQEQNKDVIVITTGMRGDGKSNFGMYSAYEYLKEFGQICSECGHEWIYSGKAIYPDNDGNAVSKGQIMEKCPSCHSNKVTHIKRFNFMRYMGYDDKEIRLKILNREELPDYSPLLGDEAVRWAYSQDFAKFDNKEMKKLFTQNRPRKLIQYINLPNFNRLDSNYREMANYWVWIMQRTDKSAIAMIFMQDKGNKDDPWHLKDLYKRVGSYNENTPMDRIKEICERTMRHPCAYDYFMIPPIPDEVYAEYEAYRNIKVFQNKEEETEINQKDLAKIMVYNLINNWQNLTGEIKRSRFDKPTVRILEKYIFSHPQTKESLIRYTTIRNWTNELSRVLKQK